ncbi:NADH-quinone oxidoreductase subunit A [Mucilaginibacter myungsuensis]|uniref:NADH-quinone oxidoreductase subunit A n=1 Tax=Mucilaginibacter myungsuensis TaxID=649104 RepID=A0A929PYV1_9SPHI|nr:NADH-quinone oxidoreductase subunit A [Mucilaginibacter myungsuensis]MBE9664656.1 NADH-quinone oxidoreductase subunit A [Mucilaginibacter myungsuensis]MDN3601138.1 NADH-quinone oxidoreductase subunit A [Mucilaginibacter myungsuensis]
MGEVAQISEFGKILVFIITGTFLVLFTLFMGKLLAPHNPTKEKLTSYECGEEPTGTAWLPFNPRFYVIALVFLLFEVEMIFIIPWSTIFGNKEIMAVDSRWGALTLVEMFIFIGILILGLVYVWRKGDLNWIKPEAETPHTRVNIPFNLYEQLNIAQSGYKVQAFNAATQKEVETALAASAIQAPATVSSDTAPATENTTAIPPVRKPMFKPSFKKPENES